MNIDQLTGLLTGFAAIVFPVAGGWAWRTENRVTVLTTQVDEQEKAETAWKSDLVRRLDRIETLLLQRPK
jgi:hypothetical protein